MNATLGGAGQPRRVIKLGGSLLTVSGIFDRLTAWLSEQSPAINAIVVGGGRAADWWRALDQRHALCPELMHELAVGTMTNNARVVVQHLPRAIWVESLADARLSRVPVLAVLDATKILQEMEQTERRARLPRSWGVTADSIAAWIALAWQAEELRLLKSCDPPPDRSTWTCSGYVDEYFPALAFPIERLRCHNLTTYGCP